MKYYIEKPNTTQTPESKKKKFFFKSETEDTLTHGLTSFKLSRNLCVHVSTTQVYIYGLHKTGN